MNEQELRKHIVRLYQALDIVPAALMLETGPPYTLNFSEEALRQIAAALEETDAGDYLKL